MTEREPDHDTVAPANGPDPALPSEPAPVEPVTETEAAPRSRRRVELNPSVQAPAEPAAPLAATAAESPVEPSTEATTAAVAPTPAPAPRAPQGPRPYAVIETGGKQYRVSVGDRISVEKLSTEAGGEVTIDKVYLVGGDGSTRVGTPTVPGATVTAQIDEHYRGEKLVIFKYKAKKRYRRRTGHRQSLTRLTITNIAG